MDEKEVVPKHTVPFLGSFNSEDGSEVKKEEVVTESVTEPKVETKVDTKVETKTEPPVATEKVAEPKVEVIDYWKKISDAVGEQVSEDQIIQKFKSSRDLESKVKTLEVKAKNYEGLDPLALDVDRAKKSGLDINLYLEARNIDPEKIEVKESLRKKFYLEHPTYKRATADILFDDEYDTKYGILEQKFDEAELADNSRKIELAKAKLEAETDSAKRFLGEWKAKHVTIPEPAAGITEEQQAEIRSAYMKKADEFVENVGELELPVGDKVFKYGVEAHLKDISSDLKNPLETLKKFGVDLVGQVIDPEVFGETIAKLYALNDVGSSLAKWALEQSDAQTLKTKLNAPTPTNAPAGGDPAEKSHDDKVGEAFEALFRRRRQERI